MNQPPPGSPSVFTLTTATITLLSLSILSLLPLSSAQSDADVMQELKKSLKPPYDLKWTGTDPCNGWEQVSCDADHRVTAIQIGNQKTPISGTLPSSLANLTQLVVFEIMGNSFHGPLPSFSGLSSLRTLNLARNNFTSIPRDFFDQMTSLASVYLDYNPFQSWTIPAGLTSASTLTNFSAISCNIIGTIPEFFNSTTFPSLLVLHLSSNHLQGGLPPSFAGITLQSLWLNGQTGRTLNGSILVLQNMTQLTEVWLNMNGHTGPIPDLSQLKQLSDLNLRDNSLTGPVPPSLMELPALTQVNLTNNKLQGPTPKFDKSVRVDMISRTNSFCLPDPGAACDARVNALIAFLQPFGYPLELAEDWDGNDPCNSWMGITCSGGNITTMNLKGKGLTGTISPVLATLTSLETVILSNNSITGTIPRELTKMTNLKTLDLSNNNLYGTVPDFADGTKVIIFGNANIGKNPPPPSSSPGSTAVPTPPGDSGGESNGTGKIVGIVAGGIFAALILGFYAFCFIRRKRKHYSKVRSPNALVIHPNHSGSDDGVKITIAGSGGNGRAASEAYSQGSSAPSDIHVVEAGNLVISIQVLRNVTNNFSQQNILGQGGFGTVYKGELHDGTKIAVKRMDSGVLGDKGLAEFKSEIAVLTKVRHRHLVGLLGYCLDGNEKLLVYEYMPRGDLSRHLFSWKEEDLKPLHWKQRLTIALDVARGVEYLHNLAQQSFIHRDLKPSNILLGDDLRAKVSDFGLVRLAPDGQQSVATRLAGTFGYLAPEYAVMGRITTKVDVYSFGVILMELITGRKALDQRQPEESQHLVPWFRRMCISKETFQKAIDPMIDIDEETLASVSTVAELAGHCTGREPHQRPEMNHAVNVLSSLVEMWKPSEAEDSEDIYGIDFDMSLPQALKKWQALEGNSAMDSSASSSFLASGDNTQTSIPTRPSGFAESFTSSDGR